MLENLKFMRSSLKKGISLDDIKGDIVGTIIELNDPELACLYIASSNHINFSDLQSLIDVVKNNPFVDDAKWVNNLIVVLNNKPSIIRNEFMNEINDLDYISLNYLNKNNTGKRM